MQPRTTRPQRGAPALSRADRCPAAPTSRAPSGSDQPRRDHRVAFLLALTLVLTTILVGFTGSANAAPKPAAKVTTKAPAHSKKPPPKPTDAQITAAAARKSQAASDVGRLSGLIVGINGKISHLSDASELAGENFLQARWNLNLAQTAATKAQNAVRAAQKNYETARSRFRLYVAAAYINRSGDSSGLLTAQNPNALLQSSDLGRYATLRQIDALGGLTRATVARANAVSKARTAVQLKTTLTTKANNARIAANRAVAYARSQRVVLVGQKSSYERQLTTAGEALTGLKNKKAAYLAWKKIDDKIKAEAARRARVLLLKRLAAQARERARLVAQAKADAQKRARIHAEQLAARRNHRSTSSSSSNSGSSDNNGSNNNGSNNNGSNNNGSNNNGSNNNGGNSSSSLGGWTPAKGQEAVRRATRWLGMDYSFAAGGYYGPSRGVCVGGVAYNACHVYGFDCSGLSMYAWSFAGIYMPHFAASQYGYGRVHPSVDQLQPGDLTFWSSNGTVGGIHHVAIYIGGGNVVHAPHTGDVVRISPMWMDGYYGATRPGT